MKTFTYRAIHEPGQIVTGEIEASESNAAASALLARGLHILDIEDAANMQGSRLAYRVGMFTGFSHRDLVRFTRDIAALLRAGLALSQSLGKLRTRDTKNAWGKLISSLQEELENGRTFSQALALYPRIFDPMYINLIKAGEEGGTLPQTLARLADLGEQREELRGKVKLAFVYPLVMLGIGAVTVIVLLTLVVPMFTKVFQDTGQTLPLPTQTLVLLSSFLQAWWWIVLPALIVTTGACVRYLNSPRGRKLRGTITLVLPQLRKITAMNEIGAFCRTLGTLLQNGIPMVRALEITAHTLQNHHFQEQTYQMVEIVRDGEALSKALSDANRFPDTVAGIVSVGEESGTLPEALLQTAQDYDRDLERELKTFTTLLEPAMIILVGAVVGFIVMAIILPIFELGDVFAP